jgi:hypothetical protein
MITHGMDLRDFGMTHSTFVGTDVFPLDRKTCPNVKDRDANTNNREPGLSLHVFSTTIRKPVRRAGFTLRALLQPM